MAEEPLDPETDFDWDEGNTDKNVPHGVQDWEIEEALDDPQGFIIETQVANDEERHKYLGRSETSGKYLRVIFTFRRRGTVRLIRPVSAVEMTFAERRRYR